MRVLKAIGAAVMAVVCGGSLVSCSGVLTARLPQSPEALQKRGLKPDEGWLVATFDKVTVNRAGEEGLDRSRSYVQVDRAGKAGENFARLKPAVASPIPNLLLATDGRPSPAGAIPVRAGDYQIGGWVVEMNTGNGWIQVRNRLPMQIPVQVKAGEATYVGHFRVIAVNGKNFLGLPVLAEGVVLLSDDFAKDQARISSYYPSIPHAAIHRSNAPALYQAEMKRIATTPREEAFWKKWL